MIGRGFHPGASGCIIRDIEITSSDEECVYVSRAKPCKECKYYGGGVGPLRCHKPKSHEDLSLEIKIWQPSPIRNYLFNPNQMFCFEPKLVSAEERLPETEKSAKERMPISPPWAEEPGRGRYRKELLLVILVIVVVIAATYILFMLLS